MSERISSRDILGRLHRQGGISKKQAAAILRAIPAAIEEGLLRDGEVRVKGLGTFRLKAVKAKTGRNPKTGETVEIPAHERIVFQPEQSFREFIANPDELLGYRVLEENEPEAISVEYPPLEPSMDEEPVPEQARETHPEPAEPPVGFTPSVVPSERPFDPLKAESELPPPRKRIHWIIPLAFSIVILLGLVFYLRNCRMEQSAVGSQQSAVSSQQSGDIIPEPGTVEPETVEPGTLEPETVEPETVEPETPEPGTVEPETVEPETVEPGTPEPGTVEPETVEPETPEPETVEPGTPNSELRTQNSELKTHLFQLAREVYDNRPLLWVLIYRANPDKITDPDLAVTGRDIIIPALEGTPWKLTRNDSIAIADGYRMVYEYYLEKGDQRAEEFRQAMLRFTPE